MENRAIHNVCSCSISDIWKNYSIGTIPLAIVPIVPMLFPDVCMPLLTLLMSLGLFLYVRHERKKSLERCAVFPYITARILLVFTAFAALVTVVNIVTSHALGGPLLRALCGHVSLYLSLFSFLTILLYMCPKIWSNTFCTECMLRGGMPQERSHLGHDYDRQNRYLAYRIICLFGSALLITLSFRIAEEFFQFSDFVVKLAYVYVPMALVVVDAVYVRSRYFVLGRLKSEHEAKTMPFGGRFKLVRVLVVGNESLLLKDTEEGLDTPFACYGPFSDSLSTDTAQRLVADCFGRGVSVRFCYSTVDPINHRSIEHFICCLNRNLAEPAHCKWVDRTVVECKFAKELSHLLRAEMHRIYTVMQTSKMYDREGRRLIDVKGYTPQFTFEELADTDINFNDNRWMLLSKFNKDLMFYTLRKAWYQYVEGQV